MQCQIVPIFIYILPFFAGENKTFLSHYFLPFTAEKRSSMTLCLSPGKQVPKHETKGKGQSAT